MFGNVHVPFKKAFVDLQMTFCEEIDFINTYFGLSEGSSLLSIKSHFLTRRTLTGNSS